MRRILIVGGYGAFGARVADRLAHDRGLEIIIAGRDEARAVASAQALGGRAARVSSARLDAREASHADLESLGARVVINASGPFQGQDYGLARAAIGAGCHYIDLADGRAFVTGIGALDAEARARDVLVVSGASSVPGISSAVVAALAVELACLTHLDIGISPGNSFDPGPATTASVLSGVGKPAPVRLDGKTQTVFGWQGLSCHDFPEIGPRWMGYVDVPDLDLFPGHYPSLETVRFRAGLEVGLFHLGLWGLSWLVRARLVARPERFAAPLLRAKRRLSRLGSDRGGMFVALKGRGHDGGARRLTWHLIARGGDGPFVPALAAVILARRLARGEEGRRGAMPCFGLITLEEVEHAAEGLDIDFMIDREPAREHTWAP